MGLMEQEFVAGLAFDLETTGLDVKTNEIVQIAVVIANSERDQKFSSLVLPSGDIPVEASNIHGFTREVLVARGARPFPDVWAECESWLHDTLASDTRPLVWAAHNGAKFDVPILRRCVYEATGRESPLLSTPRASFVDTLSMARSAMPRRAKELGWSARPYTLGSLYQSISGESLEGAHDALVDTEALARVWRWLVEEQGADALSTDGAAATLSHFQAHLQYHGYPQQRPRRSAVAERAAKQTAGKAASRAIRGGAADGAVGSDLTRVPGIGPALAQRLSKKGIGTYDELRTVWTERGGDHKRMLGWMVHSMPGANKMALAKAAKGMADEFGQ